MDRQTVHDFLVSRRARITPEQAGMPTFGKKRRVPGLRREEVASLAGVSFDYYARLERGDLSGVSDSVLEAIARALQLDEAERQHLFDLARSASAPASRARRTKPAVTRVRPALLGILNGMTGTPAYLRNARLDLLAANELCLVLFDGVLTRDALPFNLARFVFLDPYAKAFYLDWDTIARDMVASLRSRAGQDPSDRGLSDLIGELTTRSDGFAVLWARHDVRLHRTSRKRLANRIVGEIELTGDALELPGDGLTMIAYTAEPGSQAEDQLELLAAWSATAHSPETKPANAEGT
ncbi:helix-turn-helix transcriptional regulator [Actinopolymorpha sp. B17G11]|uniref:helix-turn-helix transcriptional regulator n=1 Tax=unclassified Actinopolymorpha TaxID=2627063 RepID=UPI0032D944AE